MTPEEWLKMVAKPQTGFKNIQKKVDLDDAFEAVRMAKEDLNAEHVVELIQVMGKTKEETVQEIRKWLREYQSKNTTDEKIERDFDSRFNKKEIKEVSKE